MVHSPKTQARTVQTVTQIQDPNRVKIQGNLQSQKGLDRSEASEASVRIRKAGTGWKVSAQMQGDNLATGCGYQGFKKVSAQVNPFLITITIILVLIMVLI